MKDNDHYRLFVEDFQSNTQYRIVSKNRANRGGGVAIIYDDSKIDMKQAALPLSKHEIVAATARVPRTSQQICLVSVYLPPHTNASGTQAFLSDLLKLLAKTKQKFKHP